jgi:immunoglobulin-like protein involved in spore germination
MRRVPAIFLILSCIALAAWSCGGDDDDAERTATSTEPAAATSTTAPSASPTIEAGIVIEQPAAGGNVSVPIAMSGRANVFEGALTVDALGNAAGTVLCTRHLQATSGTGTEGTWDGVLAFPPPAAETPITLRAYTFSAMDGSMTDVVERSVTVSPEQPAIVIESPACAAEVGGTLTVSGMALVFEAVLHVDIRHSSGVVMTNRVMAAGGTEFSPWSTTFDISGLTPGFYDVVAYDLSARDGAIENEFPVQISVRP